MAAEPHDLAADLLAALGSSVVEGPAQPAQAAHPPDAVQSTESAIPPAGPVQTTEPPQPKEPVTSSQAPTSDSPAAELPPKTVATTPIAPSIDPPPQPASAPSPKRPRTPDLTEESDPKRQKKDHEPSSIDMAMLLQSALGSLDNHQLEPPASVEEVVMEEAPAAPSATATPAPAKPEANLMKASENPIFMMRSMSLPVLGNLAVQILLRLAQQPLSDTQALLEQKDAEFYKTYGTLKDVFFPARRVFSDGTLLLSCDELDISDSEDRETIRMANLATVGLSLFEIEDVPFQDIHDQFLSLFVPELGDYKDSFTDFYVNIKTQVFIEAKQRQADSQSDAGLLDSYFPADLETPLKQRSGEMFLNLSEDLLIAAVKERREILAKAISDNDGDSSNLPAPESTESPATKKSLPEEFPTQKLLGDFSALLQAHLNIIIEYAEKYGVNIPVAEDQTAGSSPAAPAADIDVDVDVSMANDDLVKLLQSATAKTSEGAETETQEESLLGDGLGLSNIIQQSLESEMDLASLIRENLGDIPDGKAHTGFIMPSYANINGEVNGQPQFQSLAQLNQHNASPYHSYTQTLPQATHPVSENGDMLPPNQSSPTAILYERARQAAVAKTSSSTRREGLHSTRRPWTPEEEKALMAGLDMVKGPHWSQILSLFGANGSISDILKDRTQVQLKDKARNLKLFFLKTSSEMPYYLQSVTGELKTRAPSQAARKEAEEKARVNSEEEQARLQGIMTLASGLQNNYFPTSRSPVQAGASGLEGPMTPSVGAAAASAATTSQGPANIAPAPAAGSATSPLVIKSEPSGYQSALSHGLSQNGLPLSQQLAQFNSRTKQESHGLPQIQPRIPTPHAPLASAPNAQSYTPTQNLQPQGPPQASLLPASLPPYRPPQTSAIQPRPPSQTQQQPRPLAQAPQAHQGQDLNRSVAQSQTSTQSPLLPGAQPPSASTPGKQVQTPAQAVAQALAQQQQQQQQQQAQSQAQSQTQMSSEARDSPQQQHPQTPSSDASQNVPSQQLQNQTTQNSNTTPQPQPQPHPAAPPPNSGSSGDNYSNFPPASPNHLSADDSAEASLLETLRAAMASAPDNHASLLPSETPAR